MSNENLIFCPTCKKEKPSMEFHKDKNKKNGYCNQCKKCKRAYRISPFYKERERALEKTPDYKARKHRYNASPKGTVYGSKEKHSYRTRRILKTDVQHTLTFIQWEYILSRQNGRCAICNLIFTEDIPAIRDCMIPLSKGGALTLGNAQAVCNHCNAVKHDRAYCGLGNRWRAEFIS